MTLQPPSVSLSPFVLAGGRSRRLGQDKREIIVDGVPLITRTAALARAVCNRVPILVGDRPIPVDLAGSLLPWIGDAQPDTGPLGGIVAALRAVHHAHALILAVDLPRLTVDDLAALLTAARDAGAEPSSHIRAWVLGRDHRPEPLIAVYPRASLPLWEARLHSGEFSLGRVLDRMEVTIVPPVTRHALTNLNTDSDLAMLRKGRGES